MRPIKPRTLPQPYKALFEADIKVALGNVMTLYVEGNHRSAAMAPMIGADADAMLELCLKKLSGPESWLASLRIDSMDFDPRKIMDSKENEAMDPLRRWLVGLMGTPYTVKDYGNYLRDTLAPTSGGSESSQPLWKREKVWMPALGWVRDYLTFNSVSGFERTAETRIGWELLPSVCSHWSMNLAKTLMRVDAPRFNSTLIPAMGKAQGHTAKDIPFGPLLTAVDQLREVFAVNALYLMQGPLFYWHLHKKIREHALETAYEKHRAARPAIDAWKAETEVLDSIKLHPLLSYIANGLNTGKIETYWGDLEILFHDAKVVAGTGDVPGSPRLYDQLLSQAIVDFSQKAGTVDEWGDCVAKGRENRNPITPPAFARQIRSLGEMKDKVAAVASKLAWQTLSADVGTLRQSSADYILCDGEGYSESPDGGALGLRPVLSLGNLKVSGFSRRYSTTFNGTGAHGTASDLIGWSPMVVSGYQSPTNSVDVISRMYLPLGMRMGESYDEVVFAEAVASEPHFREFLSGLNAKGTVFVREYYKVPPKPEENVPPGLTVTDWDPAIEGSSENAVAGSLAMYYGTPEYKNELRDALKSDFMVKSRFFHRVPVKSGRPPSISVLDPDQFIRGELHWDGSIVFDDSPISLGASAATLESVVGSMVPTTTLTVGNLPDEGQNQVELKEPPIA